MLEMWSRDFGVLNLRFAPARVPAPLSLLFTIISCIPCSEVVMSGSGNIVDRWLKHRGACKVADCLCTEGSPENDEVTDKWCTCGHSPNFHASESSNPPASDDISTPAPVHSKDKGKGVQ